MGKFEQLCRAALEATKPRAFLEDNLQALNLSLMSNEPHALNDAEFESLARLCIAALNDRQCSYKGRVAVLVFVANLARHHELSPHHTDVLLGALQGLTSVFQAALVEKEQAWREMGTAVGSAHELLLLILSRVLQYRMTAAQVLQLVEQDASLALQLLLALAKVPAYEEEIAVQVATLIDELTQPNTHCNDQNGAQAAAGGDALALSAHSLSTVSRRLDSMAALMLKQNALAVLANALLARGHMRAFAGVFRTATASAAPFTSSIWSSTSACLGRQWTTHVANAFLSLSRFASAEGAAFRQHVAVGTVLVHQVWLPFLANHATYHQLIAARLKAAAELGESTATIPRLSNSIDPTLAFQPDELKHMQAVTRTLRACILAAFTLPSHFDYAKLRGASLAFLQSHLSADLSSLYVRVPVLLALTLEYACNVDAFNPHVATTMSSTTTASQTLLTALQDCLSALPLATRTDLQSLLTSSTDDLPVARDSLSFAIVLDLLAALAVPTPVPAPIPSPAESAPVVEAPAIVPPAAPTQAEVDRLLAEHAQQAREAEEVLIRERARQAELTAQRVAARQQQASTTTVVRGIAPLDTTKAVALNATPSSTAKPESLSSLASLPPLGQKKSLLGDLPSLTSGRLRIGNIPPPVELSLASARQSKPVAHDDAPSSFFCLINGHIMKHPVRSPHVPGHFERETLQKWVSNNGWICPLTGKPLDSTSALNTDPVLTEQITSYHLRRSLQKTNLNEQFDIYDF